jgi:putative endonuclease
VTTVSVRPRESGDPVLGFAKEHEVKTLVWYEVHDTRAAALTRERQIKKWNRVWKLAMIEKENSAWRDLWDDVLK